MGLMAVILLLASISCASSSHESYPQTAPTTTTAAPATKAPPYVGSSGQGGSVPAPSITVTIPGSPSYNGSTKTPAPTTAVPPVYSSDSSSTNSSLPSDRMVIRTGNVQMVVNEISVAIDGINQIAARYGGYVVNSQKWKDGERNVGNISFRVKAENYDQAIVDLRGLAKSVTSESTSSQDVTEEYVDLDSRVKNLEATEAQLLKIMESAAKTEDILSIQRELTNVRGEIEQAKGRMQYLQRTTSTSLINVQLEEAVLALKFTADKINVGTDEVIRFNPEVAGGFAPYNYQWDFGDGGTSTEKSPTHSYKSPGTYFVSLKVTDDKGYVNTLSRNSYINVTGSWKPGSVASSAWNGFTAFGRVFINVLIWLAIFSPVWIIIGGIIWWSVYRSRKRKMAAQEKLLKNQGNG